MTLKDYNNIKSRKESTYELFTNGKGTPSEFTFLGVRSHYYLKDVFFKHPVYDRISRKIENDSLTFITGNPLAGKTRIAYDTLLKRDNQTILLPIAKDGVTAFNLPQNRNDLVILIDELDVFCENCSVAINDLLRDAIKDKIKCVIICRTGPELVKVKEKIHHQLYAELVTHRINIPRFDKEEDDLNDFLKANQNFFPDTTSFDGNMGSLILPLVDMKRRYQLLVNNNSEIAISILKGLKLHYHLYNYEWKKSYYNETKIKAFCTKYLGYPISQIEWENAKNELLSTATELNFIFESEFIIIEEAYLDCHVDPILDVIDEAFNINRIKRIFKELYVDPFESQALGFPTHINDWNRIMDKENDYDQAHKIFKSIPKEVEPNASTYEILMKKTSDRVILDSLYDTLCKKFNPNDVPNSTYYGKINEFVEILETMEIKSKDHLKFRTNVSNRLVKASSENPDKSLQHLFAKYSMDEIYSNYVFIEICSKCMTTIEQYNNYVEPYLSRAENLQTNLFKAFIRICSNLKQNKIALNFLEKHFRNDKYYYLNEKANCIKEDDPLIAIELYEESAKIAPDPKRVASSFNNYAMVVYNEKINSKLDEAIANCYKGIRKSKLAHQEFPYIRHILILLVIRKTKKAKLIRRIETLILQLKLSKGAVLKILPQVDNNEKKLLLASHYKPLDKEGK